MWVGLRRNSISFVSCETRLEKRAAFFRQIPRYATGASIIRVCPGRPASKWCLGGWARGTSSEIEDGPTTSLLGLFYRLPGTVLQTASDFYDRTPDTNAMGGPWIEPRAWIFDIQELLFLPV